MQLQSLTIEFILLQISVAFSPGLIIALVVNEAVQKGRKNALQVAYGAAAGANWNNHNYCCSHHLHLFIKFLRYSPLSIFSELLYSL